MRLIDTHCHLYLPEFDSDRAAMLERAKQRGVERFYLPAIDSTTAASMFALADAWPSVCIPMMGLHPCSVKENVAEELAAVERWLSEKRFAAVGEIGLDFYWDKSHVEQQYAAFRQQMEWALHYQLPIVIHSRDAMQECIDTVRPFARRGLTGVFHCFGDSLESARQIIDLGFYLGIGGVVTYKKSGLAELLSHIAPEHLVLETDAPYLTPVPFRGKRNESAYITYVAETVAAAKNLPVEEIAEITSRNADRLFGVNA
ncbi:MAG TPA: TatD family hydrolase [Chitinophagaceae bacterium]